MIRIDILVHYFPLGIILAGFGCVLFVAFELNVVAEKFFKNLRRRGEEKEKKL